MANQTVPQTPYLEDVIVLGGQTFPVSGLAQGDAVSEFEIGLKTGNADYDNRTQAFWQVMDDFSGGMGYRYMNIRDPKQLDTFWDYPEDGYAADTRRPRHLTIGPKRTDVFPQKPAVIPGAGLLSVIPSTPYTTNGNCWLFGYGSGLFHSNDGVNFLQSYDNATGICTSIVPYPGGYMGIQAKYFSIFYNGTIPYATNGADLCGANWVGGRLIQSYQDPPPGPPLVSIVGNPGNQPPNQPPGVLMSPLPSSGAGSGATRIQYIVQHLVDGIFWDQKVLIAGYDQGILFGIVAPSDGQEHWNIEDANDNNFVGVPLVGTLSQIHFVGIEQAPWGEPAVFFVAGGQTGADLWVLDFYPRKVYPIKLGLETRIWDGKVWSGRIVISDGRNVMAYDTGRKTVDNIGLPRRDGLPPSLVQPSGQDILLTYLFPSDAYMYAVGRTAVGNGTAQDYGQLYCHNGKGWHRIGSNLTNQAPYYCVIADYGSSNNGRKLHVFGTVGSPNGMVVSSYTMPNLSSIPVYGKDHFETHGGLITGWLDGGFADITGTILKMSIDALHLSATETVKVEYQLDNNEQSAWQPCYDANGNDAQFTDTVDSLYFQKPSPQDGVEFGTVRFRLTLYRDPNNDTKTPEVRAFILTYLKKPPFRSQWNFTLDLSRMLEAANADAFKVDGVAPTMANIWTKLQALWNSQPLVRLTIPSMELNDLHVTLTGIPITFDDFRSAVGGRGKCQLKVLEPLARP